MRTLMISLFDTAQLESFEETHALWIILEDGNPKGRPITAKWEIFIDTNISGIVSFEYLVDSTSGEGIMAQKYLKHQRINTSLRNVAYWGYWKGTVRERLLLGLRLLSTGSLPIFP